MPRDDQHRQKAGLNERFARAIDRSTLVAEEWAVVVSFYAALHYVQAYFARMGSVDCDNHRKREAEIARDPKLRYILEEYQYLYKLGHLSRYKCAGLPDRPYEKAESLLARIKTHVDQALSK